MSVLRPMDTLELLFQSKLHSSFNGWTYFNNARESIYKSTYAVTNKVSYYVTSHLSTSLQSPVLIHPLFPAYWAQTLVWSHQRWSRSLWVNAAWVYSTCNTGSPCWSSGFTMSWHIPDWLIAHLPKWAHCTHKQRHAKLYRHTHTGSRRCSQYANTWEYK